MASPDVETVKINLRINAELLTEIDERWRQEGYNSRSEYIRQALRDSVHDAEVSEAVLERLLVSAEQVREEAFVDSEAVREEFLDE